MIYFEGADMSDNPGKSIPENMLEVLACPKCKTEVKVVAVKDGVAGLQCTNCGLVYPVRNGIPIMLESESFELKGE